MYYSLSSICKGYINSLKLTKGIVFTIKTLLLGILSLHLIILAAALHDYPLLSIFVVAISIISMVTIAQYILRNFDKSQSTELYLLH